MGRDPKTGTADSRALGYDGAGRIRSVIAATDPTLGQFHSYDGLDRLTGTQLGSPVTGTLGFGYDLTGNWTNQTVNGASTTYTTQTTSNRLTGLSGARVKSFGYDAAGNLTTDGATASYGYDNAGRRTTATINGQSWQYAYNGLGQRVRKTGPAGTTLYAYDEAGHLTGEYDGTGKLIQETVWLGDEPVATLRYPTGTTSGPATPYYVHADHLGTPRRITRPADNKVMWQWEAEPFGNTLPEQNPQGQGSFVYNLRFPGQVYDAETGLNQNYFRDYDPGTGRYVQSDPIALAGGANTYSYVGGNPLTHVDSVGLLTEVIFWGALPWSGGIVPGNWGQLESSFGHVSGNINGENISFGQRGWDETYPRADDYIHRQQQFRDGTGIRIPLTPRQEAELRRCLRSSNPEYSAWSNNCGTPWQECLNKLGVGTATSSLLPRDFLHDLGRSPFVEPGNFYPGPRPLQPLPTVP